MAAFIENFLLGKEYLAIEFFHSNRKEKISLLKVQKKKNELTIYQKEIFEHLDELFIHKSKIPTALIINNDQVLQKEVHSTEANDKKILHKAFPNLNLEDFYYEIWRHEQVSLIAICRKSYIDELLDKLSKEFSIVAISLGVSGISYLSGFALPLLIATNTQSISLDVQENLISHNPPQNIDYDINGLNVPNTHLLAFCGVLKFVLAPVTTGNITDLTVILNENFQQKTFFEKGLKVIVGLLLGLLAINFFLFSYYFDKSTEMSETVTVYKSEIENITKIRQRIIDKEQKLKSFTNNTASASSVIINDLVKNIPTSILLSEIMYNPLEKKIKQEETILAKNNLILMSGLTLSNTAFTGWIEKMESNKWVNNITITSFGKDEENNTKFSVSIILKK